jgi:hypothetical protein
LRFFSHDGIGDRNEKYLFVREFGVDESCTVLLEVDEQDASEEAQEEEGTDHHEQKEKNVRGPLVRER